MKALTVRQPWAWAIFNGKNVENRTQAWKYRGPLAIHASIGWSDRGEQSGLIWDAYKQVPEIRRGMERGRLGGKLAASLFPRGVMLGVVELVDVHPDAGCCRPWGESAYVEAGGRRRSTLVHMVLEDPRLLPEPLPVAGALGLWTPPPSMIRKLEAL